jgi:large subunit ribosomal protein L10
MLRKDKEQVVAELVERLRSSDTLIVADYRGLTMSEIDRVRTELLKHGARFSVVKNTLTRRAADEAGVPQLKELLEGPTAIAFVVDGDMVAVAKSLNDTARQTKVLELKGGFLQGEQVTAEQVRKLASLPPADVLQAQVIGAIVGPLTAIVGLFTAPLRELVGVIDARINQLQEREQPSAEAAPPAEIEAEPTAEVDAEAEPVAEVEEQPQPVEENESGAEAEAETKQDEGAEEEASEPEGTDDGN